MNNSNDNKMSIFPFFEEYPNMFVKQTISSLFKTLLETVMDVRTESVVIFKNTSLENLDSVLTRLSFSNAKIFSFSNNSKYNNFEILDDAADIFDEDFLLIFSERFSVVLAFTPTETKGFLEGCTSLNSSIVNKILETLRQNESYGKVIEAINQFNLDRRGNIMFDTILNKLLLRVEDSQRDLLCASDESGVLEEKDAPEPGKTTLCSNLNELVERLRARQRNNSWKQTKRGDGSQYYYWTNTALPQENINLYNKWAGENLFECTEHYPYEMAVLLPTAWALHDRTYTVEELRNIILDETNWVPRQSRYCQGTSAGISQGGAAKCSTFESYIEYLRTLSIAHHIIIK